MSVEGVTGKRKRDMRRDINKDKTTCHKLEEDIIATKMLAVDVRGALNDVSTTEFAEQVFVTTGHAKGGEDSLISGVPGSERTKSKAKDGASKALVGKKCLRCSYFCSFWSMALSRASVSLSKGQQTSMIVARELTGSVMTMSGRTFEPESVTVLSVLSVPEWTALTRRETIWLCRPVIAGMFLRQWQRMCGSVSSSKQ